jgi:hypothetical protein
MAQSAMKVRIGVSIGSHQTDIVSPDGSVMIEHEVQVRFMDMAEFFTHYMQWQTLL